jgi:hypothetical protein
MLDVHPPDHKLHGVRDFMVHLLTITIGLLIALALENAAEAFHHRQQRKEAETLIRQELAHNRDILLKAEGSLQTEIAGMTKAIVALQDLSQGKTPQGHLEEKELQFSEGPLQDAAWRTASTTGVLSYMDYEEVENFSNAYKEQDDLQAMEHTTANDYLQLMPLLKGHTGPIDPALAKEALPYARNAMGHLSGIYFIGVGTLATYNDALK